MSESSEQREPRDPRDEHDPFGELGQLAAALCEGEITLPEAARLEQLARQTPEARRFFLRYLQLHGELHWDLAAGARPAAPRGVDLPPQVEVPLRRAAGARLVPPRWAAAVVAATILAALGWWAIVVRDRVSAVVPGAASIAQLSGVFEAEWAARQGSPQVNATFGAGQRLELRSGLAEIVFHSGARVLLQGPAVFGLEGPKAGYLQVGRATTVVPPETAGFSLRTPSIVAVDLGTEFGLVVRESRSCEVHSLLGRVQVVCESDVKEPVTRELIAGQALRISSGAGGAWEIEEMPSQTQLFARSLPHTKAGSVAAMRRLVARHPRLLHHYTFEGLTPSERYRDQKGDLHLMEAVLSTGRGEGALQSGAAGFDATTSAIAPHRGSVAGNSSGVALQTDVPLQPPPEMTLELLLKAKPPDAGANPPICAAVATREDSRRCGFLLAAVDRGQLTHLLDADAPWVETEGDFACVADHWYYVASTFHADAGRTRINTCVADLSRGERTLNWIVKDRWVPGVPAASRLGIGKGFDENGAHAYPWSGQLDEVALYDAVLDRRDLEQHLLAIFENPRRQ